MKFKKHLVAAALLITTQVAPIQKAEAGLLLLNPVMAIGGYAAALATMVPYITNHDEAVRSKFHRIFAQVFILLGSVATLDHEMEMMEAELSSVYPSIPPYIIKEASAVLKEKAGETEFNAEGLKSVSMSLTEYADLEAAMPENVDENELAAFKKLLTTPVPL